MLHVLVGRPARILHQLTPDRIRPPANTITSQRPTIYTIYSKGIETLYNAQKWNWPKVPQ